MTDAGSQNEELPNVAGSIISVLLLYVRPQYSSSGSINRTYGTHKTLYIYIYLFLLTIFGPVYYIPPVIVVFASIYSLEGGGVDEMN